MMQAVPDTMEQPAQEADFESLVVELSSRLINLAADDIDREIGEVLDRICAWFDIDFVVLWQWSIESPDTIVATHYRDAEQRKLPPVPLDERHYPWYRQQMQQGRLIAIASLDELPPEAAADREDGRLFGIKSNLCVPLMLRGERPVGALGLNIVREERGWPAGVVRQLQVVAQLLTTALARQRMGKELRANEARVLAGAELAELGFYETDHRAGILRGDERFSDLLGVDPGSMPYPEVLQRWEERLHAEDRPHLMELREQLHSGRLDRAAAEYRYLHPVHGLLWIDHLSAAVERDAEGRLLRNIGVLRNIGRQKQAELELREMSHRLLQAQEHERALIARELHDDLSQRLAVLAIDVAKAEGTAGSELGAMLRSVHDALVRVSDDVHALAYQLHPSVLEELGLAEALRVECDRRTRQVGLELSLSIDPVPEDMNSETAICLFRVAQETLGNAVRHARARKVSVQLRQQDEGVILAVIDDGVGFDPQQLGAGRHLGLASMRERMRIVNGTLDIESAQGSGTTVVAWAPVKGGSR